MKAITRHTHGRSVAAALISGVVLLLVVSVFHSAAAVAANSSSDQDIVVQLGDHQFGDLREPDAIVATAGPDDVGFYPSPGEGASLGPESFEVAQDGSIWLLDSINSQLLVWEPGQSTDAARIALPSDPLAAIRDFALGLDGTIYSTYIDYGSETKTLGLCAVTPAGEVLWKAPTNIEISNTELVTGPDGSIYAYSVGDSGTWTPLTTPDGQALTVDEQSEATTPYQPLVGGHGLSGEYVSANEERFTLTDQAGQLVHAWLVKSETSLGTNFTPPTMVGGDLVTALDVFEQTENEFLWEYLILRLSPTGAIQQQFALDHRTVWGDDLFAHLRVGPDGQLYQLSTDPTTGASFAMFSLDPPPAPAPSPSPAPANVKPAPAAPSVAETPSPQATLRDAPVVPPAAWPAAAPVASPAPSKRAGGWILVGLSLLGAGLIALGVWYWYVRRRRAGSGYPISTVPVADSLSTFGWSGEADADERHRDPETVMVDAIQSSPPSAGGTV
jgi:hypothetical protein